LDSGKPESIKRHLDALRATVRQTNEQKCAAETAKIEADKGSDKIDEWNLAIKAKIEQGDTEINRLERWLFEREQSEKHIAQEEQFKNIMKLQKKRLKMKAELELTRTKPEIQECSECKTTKLPN
jgi:hypothetical protein